MSTYAERHSLSEELVEKLSRPHGCELAHAVAVIGLGGMGKTQLVLRYIHTHQEEYDTVLWLDAQRVETARSSYERCCRALGLPVEATSSDVSLQDGSLVRAVLSWLRARSEDKRWLVVVDNADDLSWDVNSIVPKGKAGTVVVTSQDARASRLLGGQMATVYVDAMEPEEAVCVLEGHFRNLVYEDTECRELIEDIASRLDRLALAVDLAGARIRTDADSGDDSDGALRQYLSDYRLNQTSLLRDEQYALASPYKKTVWTAWETSLASLRELEQRQANIYPIHLLHFMTLLNPANVQEELFRLASAGLENVCSHFGIKVPAWMQALLTDREDGEWDIFSYRATVGLLVRYGLVRPVAQYWKGITMHGLVRWRASVKMDREQYWSLYLAFVTTVCENVVIRPQHARLRRHVVVHVSSDDVVLNGCDDVELVGLLRMWRRVRDVLWAMSSFPESEVLPRKLVDVTSKMLGPEHVDTLSVTCDLARICRIRHPKEAEELLMKVMEAKSRLLGREHPDTLSATADLAMKDEEQWRVRKTEMQLIEAIKATEQALGKGKEHPATTSVKETRYRLKLGNAAPSKK